jgi:hypothetical protein
MGAKFKSKTHLLFTIFDFCAVFCAFGFEVWKKSPALIFLYKKGIKNAEFHADFNSVERVLKNCTQKKL